MSRLLPILLFVPLPLWGCATTEPRVVIKEVSRPCPVTVPTRPKPLDRPLPDDAVSLAALLAAKLLEYAGPGGFADRAESSLRTCTEAAE